MKKLLTGGAVVCVLALVAVGGATARPEATTIRVDAEMDSSNEVPKPSGDVESAHGTFTGTVTKSGSGADLRWSMQFSALTGSAVAAHIHTGKPGDAGPVAVPLCSPCTDPDAGTANLTAAQLTALQTGGTYVNIHTARNAAGEIRGQLGVVARFTRTLTPGREVPKPKGNVRRARGRFTGTVTKTGSAAELEWRLNFSRLTGRAIGAHLHQGAPGTTGRIVVPLCGPCRSGAQKTSRLRPSVVAALEDGLIYVNIHTRRNKKGEIRAQIPALPLEVS